MTKGDLSAPNQPKILRPADQMSLLGDDTQGHHNNQPARRAKARSKPQLREPSKAPEPNYDPDTLDLFSDQNLGQTSAREMPQLSQPDRPLPKTSCKNLSVRAHRPQMSGAIVASSDVKALLHDLQEIEQLLSESDSVDEDRDL